MSEYCELCGMELPNPTTPDDAVRVGADLLTKHFGDDSWKARINTLFLDICSPDECILGQLFGDYSVGKYVLGIAGHGGSHYGFDFGGHSEFTGTELNMEWYAYLCVGSVKV